MAETPLPKYLGRYQIVGELGRGAMGVVYEGRDPRIGRRVAIKTARRELMAGPGTSPDALERFFREARVAGMLNHPNIITVYDAGEQDGTAFMAMECIDGLDLGARIANGPRFRTEEAVELVATLADALAFAHERGVVHRDIKPANIMLPVDGPPKLADFGIAHVLGSTLTQEGALIGSPTYMSPEQFMGQRVDGRSDLFSLAVVLYELLTGERPFSGSAFSTVMHHVIKTDPVRPHELNYAVGEALSRVVMTALAKAPQDRYPDGHAFAAALREAVQTATTPMPRSQDGTVRMEAGSFLSEGSAVQAQEAPCYGQSALGSIPRAPTSDNASSDGTTETCVNKASEGLGRHHKTHLSAPAAIAILLLLAGVASLLYLQRTPKTGVSTANGATPRVVLDTPGDPVEQTKLKVCVYSTPYEDEFFEYQKIFKGQGDTAAYMRQAEASGRIQLLRGAGYSVGVYDSRRPSQPFYTETLTEDGNALVQLPENTEMVTFKIYQGKKLLLTVDLSTAACEKSQTFMVPPDRAVPPDTPSQ